MYSSYCRVLFQVIMCWKLQVSSSYCRVLFQVGNYKFYVLLLHAYNVQWGQVTLLSCSVFLENHTSKYPAIKAFWLHDSMSLAHFLGEAELILVPRRWK